MGATLLGAIAFGLVFATGLRWYQRIQAVQVPERRLPWVAAMFVAFVMALAALANGPGLIGGLMAVAATLGAGIFLLTAAIARQKGGTGRLRVGEPVPDFGALDDEGRPFQLSSLAGHPLLLKFFRGHW